MSSWYPRFLFIVGLLYFILPFDLIPDSLGLLGRIDDLAVIFFLWYRWRQYLRKPTQTVEPPPAADRVKGQAVTAWEVLGVSPGDSQENITKAYRQRMNEYHPDKVAHLGEELQEVSKRKTLEIQKAYEELHRVK